MSARQWVRGQVGRASALTTLCLIACVPAACSDGVDAPTVAALRAVQDGSAKAALQAYFDKRRQCAPVLTFDRETGLFHAPLDDPAAAALLTAGLLENVPGPARPDRRHYRPAAAAQRWFEAQNQAVPNEKQLCFAHRRVSTVALLFSAKRPEYRYTFELVDPAPWIKEPAIRKAFPAVAMSFESTYAGMETITVNDGKPRLDFFIPNWDNPPFPKLGVDFHGWSTADRVEFQYSLQQ